MRTPLFSGAGVAVASAVLLWSCGGGTTPSSTTSASPTSPTTPTPQTITVAIVGSTGNTAYRPNPVSAASGDTVMFKNNDSAMHHLVMDDGSADLGDIQPGGTSRGFTVRSTSGARYHCTIHPSMVGSINGSAPDPPPCNDTYGYGC